MGVSFIGTAFSEGASTNLVGGSQNGRNDNNRGPVPSRTLPLSLRLLFA